jgi:glycosyltransferase involved in cell wall biosynthesis
MSTKVASQLGPDVTLVVPVRDEEEAVDRLAALIEAQTYEAAAVLFVDGGSRDGTVARLHAWCTTRPRWRVLEPGEATPGRGRNVGIEAASTTWVALTDAGVDIDRHWLARLVSVAAADHTVDVVWGNYEAAAVGRFGALAELAIVHAPEATDRGPMRGPFVPSSLVRREAWARAGGFPNLRAGEDGIFVRRLEEHGARVGHAPEAVARWHPPATPLATYRRFRTYSRVNALAGEQQRWHYGVARMYLAASPFAILALRRRRWAAVPVAGLLARSVVTLGRRREGRGLGWALHPGRVAGVAAVLLLMDAATFAGWMDAARERRSGT